MYAIIINADRSLTWGEVEDPSPREGEVLVEVHATALNRADLLQRAGRYPPPPGWPEWMGLEIAGVVLAAPADSRWKPGDRVCALLGGGGYAQRVAVPSELVLPVPEGLSMAEAAALPEAFATSHLNLCMEGRLAAGETALIQAGASGLGSAAIQLVKERGGKVVTTVGSPEKVDFVRKLGADVVVNHREQDLAEVLEKHPVNVALDCVAGPNLGRCIKTMARGGRWVVIATLGGDVAEIDMNAFFRSGITLIGSTLRSRSLQVKAAVLAGLEQTIWPALSAGRIKPVIHQILPIQQAEQAHAVLQNRENLGKVVLAVDH